MLVGYGVISHAWNLTYYLFLDDNHLFYYDGYFKAHMNGDKYISANEFFRNVINYNPCDKNGDFLYTKCIEIFPYLNL